MSYSFKTLYLPIKNNITGVILHEKHSVYNDLISEIKVTYDPEKPIGKWVITALFVYKNQFKSLHYGKTHKEIKALLQDIKDFQYDMYLFLNL